MEYKEILRHIVSAEREAAQLIMEAHGVMAEEKSSRRDVVTEYDRTVQELLTMRLSAALPDAHFFSEEQEKHDDINASALFVIDPIDGTMNFVRGLHQSCLSVAYAERGEVKAAAIYNPYVDELFTAVRGEGAQLNGRPIRVTGAPLAQSVVCFGTAPYYEELTEQTFRVMRRLYGASLDLRRQGAAALDLCSVAAGRAGLYAELRTSLWDYAAGKLIVEEAGGVCLAEDGSALPFTGEKSSVLAGSRETVREYLECLR